MGCTHHSFNIRLKKEERIDIRAINEVKEDYEKICSIYDGCHTLS